MNLPSKEAKVKMYHQYNDTQSYGVKTQTKTITDLYWGLIDDQSHQ